MTHAQILRGLLIFWSVWFGVVTMTNLADALVAAGVLPADWRFASGNYAQIQAVTSRYPTPAWLLPPLFAGVIAWEALACGLFARAWTAWDGGANGRARARLAYAVSLGLWAVFLIVDEIFIAYEVAGTHLGLLIANVVCLIALALPGGVTDDEHHPIA